MCVNHNFQGYIFLLEYPDLPERLKQYATN